MTDVAKLQSDLREKDVIINNLEATIDEFKKKLLTSEMQSSTLQGRLERIQLQLDDKKKRLEESNTLHLEELDHLRNEYDEAFEEKAQTMQQLKDVFQLQMTEMEFRCWYLLTDYVPGLIKSSADLFSVLNDKPSQGAVEHVMRQTLKLYVETITDALELGHQRVGNVYCALRDEVDLVRSKGYREVVNAQETTASALQRERVALDTSMREINDMRREVTAAEETKLIYMKQIEQFETLVAKLSRERDTLECENGTLQGKLRTQYETETGLMSAVKLTSQQHELRHKLTEKVATLEHALDQSLFEAHTLKGSVQQLEKERQALIVKESKLRQANEVLSERLRGYEQRESEQHRHIQDEIQELRWTRARANEALQRELLQTRVELESQLQHQLQSNSQHQHRSRTPTTPTSHTTPRRNVQSPGRMGAGSATRSGGGGPPYVVLNGTPNMVGASGGGGNNNSALRYVKSPQRVGYSARVPSPPPLYRY
eukprot:PhF_6_TR20498/c0_g1_i2/m.29533